MSGRIERAFSALKAKLDEIIPVTAIALVASAGPGAPPSYVKGLTCRRTFIQSTRRKFSQIQSPGKKSGR